MSLQHVVKEECKAEGHSPQQEAKGLWVFIPKEPTYVGLFVCGVWNPDEGSQHVEMEMFGATGFCAPKEHLRGLRPDLATLDTDNMQRLIAQLFRH